jgi:hypothetical protein
VLESIGLLKEDFYLFMDKEFLIRMFKNNYKIGQLNKILAGFRVHETSKTLLGLNKTDGFKEKGYVISDNKQITNMHGKEYTQNPKLIFKLMYRLEKLVMGIYFESLLFSYKWKGKNVKELSYKNCIYL